MTWNYRVMKYKNGEVGVHEVYYDDDGKVQNWTKQAIIVGEDLKDLLDTLKMIRNDITKQVPLIYE